MIQCASLPEMTVFDVYEGRNTAVFLFRGLDTYL